jgi:hypothetical protein
MKHFSILSLCLLIITINSYAQHSVYYEMRTYQCHEGKRPELIQRFQNHTLKLFEKQGIKNIAYFIPTDVNTNSLTFILAYPDKISRDRMWNVFATDPEWQTVRKNSEVNGPLVETVQQVFMMLAPELSTGIAVLPSDRDRIFELRTYFLYPGRVDAINARFRDHTRTLFERHGMINVVYWFTVEPESQQSRLVYLLAHDSEVAAKNSFDQFRDDPDWKAARDASELSGPIVEKIESVYFKALLFSPLK